ncbi:MAG: DNA-protecting protein DprA, partial [Firmicutes bacterium HGW-Firmicutes-13]
FTSYGKRTALNISRYLARSGFTVISGLARGIDTFAHSGALEAGGRTVAVLGSGLDIIYPRDNEGLAEEIIKNGALVSEFPLGTLPLPGNFPRRNRIISGLSTGVVVVEAAERSGALITADCALEQGKEVFVVPGNIDSPYSKGCNKLIKEGAVLVEEPAHILQELGYDFSNDLGKGKTFTDLTVEEKELMKIITNQPLHIDDILASSSLSPQKLNTLLTIMELKGAVKQLVGKYFIKV